MSAKKSNSPLHLVRSQSFRRYSMVILFTIGMTLVAVFTIGRIQWQPFLQANHSAVSFTNAGKLHFQNGGRKDSRTEFHNNSIESAS
jgi:hypothetical protein